MTTITNDCCDEWRWVDAGGRRGPLTDDEYTAWVLFQYGLTEADRLAEMYKAVAEREGWRRQTASGYTLHAIRRQGDITRIVIGDEAGWRWQVWRGHKAIRSILGPPAASAAEAVRLADSLIVVRRAREGAGGVMTAPIAEQIASKEVASASGSHSDHPPDEKASAMTICDYCEGDGEVDCESCDGSGSWPDDDASSCGECGGLGRVECTECDGTGQEG